MLLMVFFNNNNNFDAEFGSVFVFSFSFVNSLCWWCSIYSSQVPSTWRRIKGEFFWAKKGSQATNWSDCLQNLAIHAKIKK